MESWGQMKTLCVGGWSDGSATCHAWNVNDGAAVQGYDNRRKKVYYCQPSVNPAKTSIVWPRTVFFVAVWSNLDVVSDWGSWHLQDVTGNVPACTCKENVWCLLGKVWGSVVPCERWLFPRVWLFVVRLTRKRRLHQEDVSGVVRGHCFLSRETCPQVCVFFFFFFFWTCVSVAFYFLPHILMQLEIRSWLYR